jgi:hypothetical protein
VLESQIERIVQHYADRTTLWGAFLVRVDLPIFQNACFQPEPDQLDQTRVSFPFRGCEAAGCLCPKHFVWLARSPRHCRKPMSVGFCIVTSSPPIFMLTQQGHVKVMDFLANRLADLPRAVHWRIKAIRLLNRECSSHSSYPGIEQWHTRPKWVPDIYAAAPPPRGILRRGPGRPTTPDCSAGFRG